MSILASFDLILSRLALHLDCQISYVNFDIYL